MSLENLELSKIKIIIISILLIFILGFVIIFAINLHVKSSMKDKVITSEMASDLEDVDCILVLGAMVWGDNKPSYMLEDRLLQSIELFENGASDRIIMSGDHGQEDYDEVNIMKKFAIDRGVPSNKIFMDHAGFSTYESVYRAREVFQADKLIIVTQEYHLYRALYIAEKLGLEAYGVASDPREYIGQEMRDIREIAASVKDFFNVIIKPEPKYLGEVVPISGDGDITNDKPES